MIDIHAHILPGIDDGARDIYDTLAMAEMAANSGVKAIVATPHCNLPGRYDNYFGKAYIEAYEKATSAIKKAGIDVQIYPGMEVFATYDLPDLIVNKKIMPLNQSRYILIEFAFEEEPGFASDVLKRVAAVGAKPVIAHAERYRFIQDNPQIAYEWHKKGYLIQINKASYLGKFGNQAQNLVKSLLKHELVSVVASDAHGTVVRTPYLMDAYEEMGGEFSKEKLHCWFQENPWKICQNISIGSKEAIPF